MTFHAGGLFVSAVAAATSKCVDILPPLSTRSRPVVANVTRTSSAITEADTRHVVLAKLHRITQCHSDK